MIVVFKIKETGNSGSKYFLKLEEKKIKLRINKII